jgi:hypothetical protein
MGAPVAGLWEREKYAKCLLKRTRASLAISEFSHLAHDSRIRRGRVALANVGPTLRLSSHAPTKFERRPIVACVPF